MNKNTTVDYFGEPNETSRFFVIQLNTKYGPHFHISFTRPTKAQIRKWWKLARKVNKSAINWI